MNDHLARDNGVALRAKNQPPPLQNYDFYRADTALQEAVTREGAPWAHDDLSEFGRLLGRAETIEWGALANRNPPILHSYDRYGDALDAVEFHATWHQMMALGVGAGVHAAPWAEPRPGAHVARAAKVMLLVQAEAGVQCPITMTYGVVPALRRQSDIAAQMLPRIYSRQYDKRFIPVTLKTGMLMGMGLDGKAGRLRSARQRDARQPPRHQWTGPTLPPCWSQMVHVGAHVRRISGARADAVRSLMLLPAALHTGWRTECAALAPPKGQAWQQIERIERGRVRERAWLAGWRGGPRHSSPD